MLVADLRPPTERSLPFRRFAAMRIHPAAGCYALSTSGGTIVYIGRTTNLARRIGEHLDAPEKQEPTPAGRTATVSYRRCPPKNLPDLEAHWIDQFEASNSGRLPWFNKVEPARP